MTVPPYLRKCHNTLKKLSWNVTDDNSILDTESETLMGVPGLVSLQQAATRSVCSYDGYECHSPRYILHARVVSLARLNYFTLCHVIDSGSTAYTHLLSGLLLFSTYSLLSACFLAFSCYRCMYLTIRAYNIIIMMHFNEILQSDWSLEKV